jgi:hypothetical protein
MNSVNNDSFNSPAAPRTEKRWQRRFLFIVVLLSVAAGFLAINNSAVRLRDRVKPLDSSWSPLVRITATQVDEKIESAIQAASLKTAEPADWETICRRLSLALVGSSLSLEEYRAIEAKFVASNQVGSNENETAPGNSLKPRIEFWTDYLLADPRWSQYFAERFSRALLGTSNGPFLIFRRGRFESWLAEEFRKGTPYDQLVREMVSSKGLWTGNPEVNFMTAAITNGGGRQVDPVLLAGRVSRAFLGMRIDCLQCHDDLLDKIYFGDETSPESGKQLNFHELAAFFGSSSISRNPLMGLRDSRRPYKTKLVGDSEETQISPDVPFEISKKIDQGTPREQLAAWLTRKDNRPFARATANRVWAYMFGKPLSNPVDDIPLHGPFPPGLEALADCLIANDFDLRSLVRAIVATKTFQRDSRLGEEDIREEHESTWATFPLTPLRPEQMAASLHQACRLEAIDQESSLISRLERYGTLRDFRKAYGDLGDDEFIPQGITIPQRLLVMNGKFVRERINGNPIMNAGSQISILASNDSAAVDAAYISALNRLPTSTERDEFVATIIGKNGPNRMRALGDLFWVLLNSTEFAWNH